MLRPEGLGNRTLDLQACSSVPQPTAPPRAPAAPSNFQKYEITGKIIGLYFGNNYRKLVGVRARETQRNYKTGRQYKQ